MYGQVRFEQSTIIRNEGTKGETLETKIARVMLNKEPIKDGAPIIFTAREEGVRPSTNIRTDRFEVAIEAMDKVQKSYKARREERAKLDEAAKAGKVGAAESIQGTTETPASTSGTGK